MSKSSSYRSNKSAYSSAVSHEHEPFFALQGPVQAKKEDAFFQPASGLVQRKLSIGQPNDKFEKEADHVADKVVQRLATPMEDEAFATNDQRMRRDRELRTKPDIQQKCAHCDEEEKHPVQKKEESPEQGTPSVASASLTSRIESSQGKGSSLPPSALNEMQSSFGKDFSNVNIHTDAASVNMNRDLGAQAFTHGNDIYFNSGKFNPDSTAGKHLLAHELTHVVQQGGAGNIQLAPALPQAPPKAPELKPVALLTNDNHCGDMTFMIEWQLSNEAAAAGGYVIQELTITYLVFDKFGRPVSRKEKSPMHYFEAWRVLPNSKDMDPGSTDNFSFDIRTPDRTASTVGFVYFTAVAQYHDNVSPEEMPGHMVSGNRRTAAGLLLSSTQDPRLGGKVSKSVPHEFSFHWDCTKPGGDHTNVIDKQIP